MNLPHDCKLDVKPVGFDGLLRPKLFFVVEVESKELGYSVVRYVLGRPFLLRLRLWCAARQCVRMVRKLKKFHARHV